MSHRGYTDIPTAELDKLYDRAQLYLDALRECRTVLVGIQHQVAQVPQGGYSTRMTEAEKSVADAIAAIDLLLPAPPVRDTKENA